MEVIKQRTMVSKGASSISIMRDLVADGGPAALYRGARIPAPRRAAPRRADAARHPLPPTAGVGAAALSWAPYFSIYFAAYEMLIGHFSPGSDPSFAASLGCGLAAGIGAAALTTPMDVVKTQVQVGRAGLGAGGAAMRAGATNALAVARHIAATEGPAGFFRGAAPRVINLAPISSLTIAFYSAMHGSLRAADQGAAPSGK